MNRTERKELEHIKHELCELRRVIAELLWLLQPHHHYTIRIEGNMAITAGSTGTFAAQLLDNGAPVAGFTPSFSWTANDTLASLQPSTDTLTCVVTVPATDTTTTINLTAETTAPDGTKASGSIAISVTPSVTPQKYTVSITQSA